MSSATARQLRWTATGDSVWTAPVGRFVAEITMCGASTVGVNIYVCLFAGRLAANVQGSLAEAKSVVEWHVVCELLAMERSLSGTT